MEYAIQLNDTDCIPVRNYDFNRYVGYAGQEDIDKYFDPMTVSLISKKITQLLQGVDPKNRPIIVPDQMILNVLDSVNLNFRPPTGDIYARYNIPTGENCPSYIQQMIDQAIEIIYADVKNNLEMEENNKKLTIWTTVLGDFNEHQLRSHSIIKVQEKRPNPMQFNMNY